MNWFSRWAKPDRTDLTSGAARVYPKSTPWGGADRYNWHLHSRCATPDATGLRWDLPGDLYPSTHRYPNGTPLPSLGGADRIGWSLKSDLGPADLSGWHIGPDMYRPTQRDPYGNPSPHGWDGSGPVVAGSWGWENARWVAQTQQTRPSPTHNPHWPGIPETPQLPRKTWRQLITADPRGDEADLPVFHGVPVAPSHTYSWGGNGVALRVGTSGSDQHGLLVKLFDQYIQE